jgi:PhnB protein
MANRGRPVPEGFHTLTPYLVIAGASRAIDFYKQAFGAKERFRMPGPDGRIMHAELQVGDSRLLLCDEMPEMGGRSPQTLKGSPVSLFLYVPDVDATFKQAVAAGAQEKAPVSDMFWGDRYAKLADPFGHKWSMATHIEDLSPKEMMRRSEEAMRNQK